MRVIYSVFLAALMALPSYGGSIKSDKPSYGLGELVIIRGQAEDGEEIRYTPLNPPDLAAYINGSDICFSSGLKPGVIQILAATVNFDARSFEIETVLVRVEGTAPTPPNPVPPNPGPDPPVPNPDLTGFARMVFDASMRIPANVRKRDAPYFALVYGSVARQMKEGGKFDTPEKAKLGVQEAFNLSQHKFSKEWEPIIDWLNVQIKNNASSLVTARQALEAVEAGITAAGK